MLARYMASTCVCVLVVGYSGTVSKRLNFGTRKQRHTIAKGVDKFFDVQKILINSNVVIPNGATNAGGVG